MTLAKFHITRGPKDRTISWDIWVDPVKIPIRKSHPTSCPHHLVWVVKRIPSGCLKPKTNHELSQKTNKPIVVCECDGYLVKEAKQ